MRQAAEREKLCFLECLKPAIQLLKGLLVVGFEFH